MPMQAILITGNPFKQLASIYGDLTWEQESALEEGIILTRKKHGWIQSHSGTFDRFKVGKSVEGSFLDFLEDDEAICFAIDEFTTENRLEVREIYEQFVQELEESNPELTDNGVVVGKVLIASKEICGLFTDDPELESNE